MKRGMLARVPLRLRVTAAFAAAVALVLVATGTFLYLRLAHELDVTIEQSLRSRAGDVAALAGRGLDASGRSSLTERGENLAQILGPDGAIVDSTPSVRARPLLTRAEVREALRHAVVVDRERPVADDPARLLATRDGNGVVVVGASLEDRSDALHRLLRLLLIGGPAALALASLAGYLVAGRALAPVEAMRRRAAALEPGERLPVPPAGDELTRLGQTLNEMLARLDAALERERALVADAGHELRTPLSVLKTELEVALRHPRTAAELERTVRSAADHTDRVARLAEDLLVIARADQGHLPVHREPVAVADLFAGVRRRFGAHVRADRSDLRLEADPLRLAQALDNLVDNALRHGGGAAELAAEASDGHVGLHVRDSGPGFPPSFLPAAFERFTRADPGRTGGGAGLGLAIVDAIARAHGGRAGAANRDGGGADVWLRVPQSSSSDSTTTTP
jgi:two-component system OmpR family sensor kinase